MEYGSIEKEIAQKYLRIIKSEDIIMKKRNLLLILFTLLCLVTNIYGETQKITKYSETELITRPVI